MVIRQGYSLPFPEFPPRCVLSNNCSTVRNLQFIQSAILELLEKQLIHVHDSPPHCVNPLTVVEGRIAPRSPPIEFAPTLCRVHPLTFRVRNP